MFGLFKRTKIQEWEIQLLKEVLKDLPGKFSSLVDQINEGLLRSVLVDASDIPGYVSFGFNFAIYNKYLKKNERSYKLTGIRVFDNYKSAFTTYTIYISSGIVNGYSLEGGKNHRVDIKKINLSGFKQEFIGESDYSRIADILDEEEKKLLNSSDVYSVLVEGNEYFHVKDLEDGDFVGIDEKKNVYRITHDPLNVVKLGKNLVEILR